jgi:hypothetical protein
VGAERRFPETKEMTPTRLLKIYVALGETA